VEKKECGNINKGVDIKSEKKGRVNGGEGKNKSEGKREVCVKGDDGEKRS
jgi:hypothetical protein